MGDGRAEGSSAIGDGGQAVVSLMPHADGTGSGSLLDSILSTLLKKSSGDVWIYPELEMKILHYNTIYSIVKVHERTTPCPGCTHVTVYARHVS